MEMTKDKIGFQIGDRIVSLQTNEEGTISRLCPDPTILYVRWDRGHTQEMVKTTTLQILESA